MPPQQPSPGYGPTMPAPPNHGPGQYDFIMTAPGRPPSGLSAASMPKRILIVLGGVLLLLFIGGIFLSIVNKPTGVNNATLLAIAKKQTELARVSLTPVTQAASPPTRDFAQTTYMVMLSDQTTFVSFIKAHGFKVNPKVLAGNVNSATDVALTQAQSTGTYDAAYVSIAQSQLTAYEQSLSQAYTASKSVRERQLLQTAYNQAQLLLMMSKQKY